MKGLTGKEIGIIIHEHNLKEGRPISDVNLKMVQDWWEEELAYLEKCGLIIVCQER